MVGIISSVRIVGFVVARWPIMFSDLDSGTSSPDSSYCVVLLGKTRYSLHPGV